MDSEFPDPATIRAVLTLASHAPSFHHCQPWHWVVGPGNLQLRADPSRQAPLLLSCGAALHHCAVALAAMGWRASVHRLPVPAEGDLLAVIEVVRKPPEDLDLMLAGAITRRRADPRSYSSWPVPWGDIALMGARAARAGVMLRQIDLLPRLHEIMTESVSRHAVLLALGTEADDDLARLRAGEATSLVLLSATAMGLASCPVTGPLEMPQTREAVRADVFGSSGYPQMLMRVGWAAVGAEPLPAAPRRPLPDVADRLPDDAGVGVVG